MKNILQNRNFFILFLFIILVFIISRECFATTTHTFTTYDGLNYEVELDLDNPILPKNCGYFVSISPIYESCTIHFYDLDEAELKVKSFTHSDKEDYIDIKLYRKSDGKETNNNDVCVKHYIQTFYKNGTKTELEQTSYGYYGISFSTNRSRIWLLFFCTTI